MESSNEDKERRDLRERFEHRTLTDLDIARMAIGGMEEMGTPHWVANYQRLYIVEGDITTLEVDAIVNAANETLLGGGGVDGAIHRAAGPELLAECRTLGGCDTGEAKITKGYNLPAKWVIHTVGPVWEDGRSNEDRMLRSCYEHSLGLARENNLRSVAFPAISTGAYGFPPDRAARIATQAIGDFLRRDRTLERVTLVCFDRRTYVEYFVSMYLQHGSAQIRFVLGENRDEWDRPSLLIERAVSRQT